MKFISFATFDVAKAAELAKVSDKVWASAPPGIKILSAYVCQGMAFAGVPPNTLVSIDILEAESNEALAAINYPMALAGASIWNVPVMELPTGGAAEIEKKMRS
jgi:hypothetical protein